MTWLVLSGLSLVIWTVLLAGRGGFWLFRERDDRAVPPPPPVWPDIIAVVPARNEADVLPRTLPSLLRAYSGRIEVVLVDDQSTDGTAEAARAAAHSIGAADRVTVLAGQPLPAGWTGKLWAMAQGVAHARGRPDAPRLLLFTDADIAYEPGALDAIVARGEAGGLALVSVMVQLRCTSLAERYLVPAFVYFFAMLYPFAWVNDPKHGTAAAAGGCMLVRRAALDGAGGVAAIRGALIDDVAMGGALKRHGPVWLGLTRRIHSIRAYPTVADFGDMVARTAYTQLRYSPVLLAGTFLGMGLTYLAAPLAALFAPGAAGWIGLAVWLAMIASFVPISQQYGRPWLQGTLLPVVAAWYCVFTWQSFWRYATGQGGRWKGRVQAPPSGRS